MKAEYLLFNLLILFFPIIGMFLFKERVWPKPKATLFSVIPVAVVFILWDYLVTDWWWSFNPSYITGLKVANLPIEEIMFFFVVPWSCLVLWENIKGRIPGRFNRGIEPYVLAASGLLGLASILNNLWYTMVVSGLLMILTAVSWQYGYWLRKKAVLVFMGVVLGLTFIFNGYLTARPVVLYNESVMTSLRVLTVPIEDFFYGLILVGSVLIIYERVLRRSA